MEKVLVTGATGNVGRAVMTSLQAIGHQLDLYAGVRDIDVDAGLFDYSKVKLVQFDFYHSSTYTSALANCDILFLLRPPHISDVEKYFKPIVETCKDKGVRHIIFLSVQGVEKSKIIPHHKIEKLIVDSGISYTFLRPAYFMQNFSTTLRSDIVDKKRIFLSAGNAKFTLIDIRDIGMVAAIIMTNTSEHINKSYALTCDERLSFSEMAMALSENLGVHIQYQSPSLVNFFLTKRKERYPVVLILVMIMLHYLPRFQKEPEITDWVEKITKKRAITFEQFINDHKKFFLANINRG